MEKLVRMPMRPPRWTAAGLLVGNALVAAVLALATSLDLEASRKAHMAHATEAADNLARSLSVELASEFHLVENALATIAESARDRPGTPGGAAATQPDGQLRRQASLLPFVKTIRIDGTGTHAPRDGLDACLEAAGPAYGAAARSAATVVVSEPVFCEAAGGWGLLLARGTGVPGHADGGLVYAALSAVHFQALFSSYAIGEGGAISLRSDSLRLAARYSEAEPRSSQGMGGNDVSAQLRAALERDRQAGSYITATALDKVERINAYRRVPGYPYTVVAGYSATSYLAPWAASARRHWCFTGAVILLVGLGSLWLYRQHAHQYEVGRYASQLAKEQHAMLDNDLVGILRVRDGKVRWANAAASRILGRPKQALVDAALSSLWPETERQGASGDADAEAMRMAGRCHAQREVHHPAGHRLWLDISGAQVGRGESLWMLVDIDQIKRNEEAAQQLSLHDPLTGLANRRLFDEMLRQALAHSQRAATGLAVCMMDLDGFKSINDTHGNDAGDRVLQEVAQRLRAVFRANDSITRLGGDEFAWFLSDVASQSDAAPALQRCVDAIRLPIGLDDGTRVAVDCSIGVEMVVAGDADPARLKRSADMAMYQAKQSGRGRFVFAGVQGRPQGQLNGTP